MADLNEFFGGYLPWFAMFTKWDESLGLLDRWESGPLVDQLMKNRKSDPSIYLLADHLNEQPLTMFKQLAQKLKS